jgi:hypothetical protein
MAMYSKYIRKGKVEPMQSIPFHGKAPLKRLMMLDKDRINEAGIHIAVHQIKNLPKKIPKYSELHKHDCDEVNLILSEDSKLKYRIQLGKEIYKITSPSTIFIPKGLRHSAEVISGKGMFVCIVLRGKYKASK